MNLVLNGMEEMNEQELIVVDGGVVLETIAVICAVVTLAYGAGYVTGRIIEIASR